MDHKYSVKTKLSHTLLMARLNWCGSIFMEVSILY
jgi:hypothetical protein